LNDLRSGYLLNAKDSRDYIAINKGEHFIRSLSIEYFAFNTVNVREDFTYNILVEVVK